MDQTIQVEKIQVFDGAGRLRWTGLNQVPSVRCRLLLEVPTLVSIPAALADRLKDTNVVNDTPV